MVDRITIMVTGIGSGTVGEQIIKALRLSSMKYEIVGCDMLPMSKGFVDVKYSYLVPPAVDADYISCVMAICRKHNVRALFPGSEMELCALSAERERIKEAGVFCPINPVPVLDICMDKYKTMTFLSQHGFPFPETAKVKSITDAEMIDFFPAVLKPSVGGSGSGNVFLAQTSREVCALSEYLLGIYPEFIIQQYVGTPETEYTVGVLVSMDGELLNSIAVKRSVLSSLSNRIKIENRTGKSKYGPVLAISSGISQGEIGRFPEVTKICERLAITLGCRGAVNIQCRQVDGDVYIFEINPRFSGTSSLRAMVGYNEPDVLIRKHLLGEDISPGFDYDSGIILRGIKECLVTELHPCDGRTLL